MGKSNRRDYDHNYVKLIYPLMDSEAFHNLSNAGMRVLLSLLRRHNGFNNGVISLSVREVAKETPMGKDSASKAFEELQLKGFIEVMKKGQFTYRNATEYRITFLPLTSSNLKAKPPATDEWKRYDCKQNKVPDIILKVL